MSSQTTLTVETSTSVSVPASDPAPAPAPEQKLNPSEECIKFLKLFPNPTNVKDLLRIYPDAITTVCRSDSDWNTIVTAFASNPELFELFFKIFKEIKVDFLQKTGLDDESVLDMCSYYSPSFDLALKSDIFTPEFVCRTNKSGRTLIEVICGQSNTNIESRVESLKILFGSDKCTPEYVASHYEFFKTVNPCFMTVVEGSPKYVKPKTPEQIEAERVLAEAEKKRIEKEEELRLLYEKMEQFKIEHAELLKQREELLKKSNGNASITTKV